MLNNLIGLTNEITNKNIRNVVMNSTSITNNNSNKIAIEPNATVNKDTNAFIQKYDKKKKEEANYKDDSLFKGLEFEGKIRNKKEREQLKGFNCEICKEVK